MNDLIQGETGKGDADASASGTGLVYPLSRRSDQDYIMFTSVDRCNNEFEKCSLPIQGGIADNNAVDWAGGKLNPLQAMVAEGVGDIVSGGDISKQVDTAKDKIAKDEGGIKKFIESATASAALESVKMNCCQDSRVQSSTLTFSCSSKVQL